MSISIDTDLYWVANKLHISAQKMEAYGNKSVEDIAEAEAAQGNSSAAEILMQMLTDPSQLVKLLKLTDVNNRYAILSNLSEKDLKDLLPLLEKEELVTSLNFFNKEKLLGMLENVPKEELVKYVSQMFSPEQIMQLMPEVKLDKMLQSKELDKGLVLKHLKKIPPAILARMLEAVTGKAANGQQAIAQSGDSEASGSLAGGASGLELAQANASAQMAAQMSYQMAQGAGRIFESSSDNAQSGIGSSIQLNLIDQIAQLSPDKYKEALVSMPEQNKRFFCLSMAKEDPNVFNLIDASGYTAILAGKEKPELVKAAMALETETLIKMAEELPEELLAVTLTQIDPDKFADVLSSDYQDILKQITLA